MSKMSQKEAVFQAVTSVLAESNIQVEGEVSSFMTKERRAQVSTILFESFKSGTIELDKEFSDSDLKAYVSGLQSNWLRKDKRLNDGIAYKAKNPGSRTGQTDSQLKALRALQSTKTDSSEIAELQTYIDKRVAELSTSKAKPTKEVVYSDLPAELQAKYSA